MFRINRLTDYGIVVMVELASRAGPWQGQGSAQNAREIAAHTQLPAPVVSKILKSLTRAGLLDSQRGSKGGYSLSRAPGQVTVAEMIVALEGPVGITECAIHPGVCAQESSCHVREPWKLINTAVRSTLEEVTLADLARPALGFLPVVGPDGDTETDASELGRAE